MSNMTRLLESMGPLILSSYRKSICLVSTLGLSWIMDHERRVRWTQSHRSQNVHKFGDESETAIRLLLATGQLDMSLIIGCIDSYPSIDMSRITMAPPHQPEPNHAGKEQYPLE